MSSHLSNTDINRYRSNSVSAGEALEFDDHLSQCESCRSQFIDKRQLEATYRFVRSNLATAGDEVEFHPVSEQMESYVHGDLDPEEREIIQSHVLLCPECARDIDDLMKLSDAIAAGKSERQSGTLQVPLAHAPFWQRTAFRIGIEVLLVAFVCSAGLWFARRETQVAINELRAEAQNLRAENERLRTAEATPNPPKTTLELKDGDQIITLDDTGELSGLESSQERKYRLAVKELLATGRVVVPPIVAQLRGEPEIMMGNEGAKSHFRLLGPFGVVVETDRPTFRWGILSSAVGYEVSVSDDGGEVVKSPLISRTEWQSSARLARGRVYHWQVRAMTKVGGEEKSPPGGQPDAKFSILDANALNEVSWARNAYPGSHLILGIAYAKAGLMDQAEREFRSLREENPESDIANRIVDSLTRRSQR